MSNSGCRSPPAASSSAANLIPPAFLASQESPAHSRRDAAACSNHQHHKNIPSHLLSERSVAGYAPSPRIRRSVVRLHNQQQHHAAAPAGNMEEEQEPQSMISIQSGYRPQPQARSVNQKGPGLTLQQQQQQTYQDQHHEEHQLYHDQQQQHESDGSGDGGDEGRVNVRNEGTQTRDYATAGRSMMLRRKSGNQYFSLLYFAFHLSISICLLRVNGELSSC